MMREKQTQIEPLISFWIKAPEKRTLALSIETHKLLMAVSIALIAILLSFLGTLLFFRELHISRKLGEEILALRLRDKVLRAAPQVTATAATPAETTATPQKEAPAAEQPPTISARMTDLTIECGEGSCLAKIAMVPAKTGVASGTLLLVLETEVLRIGTSPAPGQTRKRYFTYPHDLVRDTFDEKILSSLPKKAFHFSRALQTSASFEIEKHVRPLALNVYLFDTNDSVVHHERKAIERNVSDVE